MGQKRNIQIINLVAIGTIEEQMLTKLKFKTDLFDGVLNGGEDAVFLQNNKLETLVKDLGFVQEEVQGQTAPEPEASADIKEDELEKKTAIPKMDAADTMEPEEEVPETDSTLQSKPEDIVSQGVTFLGNLIKTLKDPEATQSLVDTLVHEDTLTGKTSINIPVSSKESVLQFVKLIGTLLK